MPVLFDISSYLTDKYFDIVWGCHHPGDPFKWTSQTSIFWMAQARVLLFFDISRYLTDKYFDIVLGVPSPRGSPQTSIFWMAQVWVLLFWYQEIFYRQIFWHSLGVPPPGVPPKWIPKNQFLSARARVPMFSDISRYLTDKYLTLLFWRFLNQLFLNNCWFYGRLKVLLSVTALGTRRLFTGFAVKLPSS